MFKCLLLTSLTVASTFAAPETPTAVLASNGFDLRIIGGRIADPGEFPYQVSYQWGILGIYQHICGGSIISPKWILTAGHCITTEVWWGSSRVVAGTNNLALLNWHHTQIRQIERKIIHPSFGGYVGPNDIALLKLWEAFIITDFVKPIGLPQFGEEPEEAQATLSGWGAIINIFPVATLTLNAIDLPVFSDEQCTEALDKILHGSHRDPFNNVSNICTGPLHGGQGACSGDSGSPLVQNDTVIGVVSWGVFPCARRGSVSVYTQVSSFIDFIEEHTSSDLYK